MLVAPTADGSRPGYWGIPGWDTIKKIGQTIIPGGETGYVDLYGDDGAGDVIKKLGQTIVPGGDPGYIDLYGDKDQPMPQGSPGQINPPFEQNQYPDPIQTGGKGTQYEEPGGFDWKKALATVLPGGDPGYIPGGLYNAAGQLIFGGPTQAGEPVDKEALQRQVDLMTGGGISPHDPDFKIDPAGPYGWEGEDKDDPWWLKLGQTIMPGGKPGFINLYDSDNGDPSIFRQAANIGVPMAVGKWAHDYQKDYLAKQPKFPMDETGIKFQTAAEAMADEDLRFKPKEQYVAQGGRIGYEIGGPVLSEEENAMVMDMLNKGMDHDTISTITGVTPEDIRIIINQINEAQKGLEESGALENLKAQGGRIGADEGGLMNLGGMEKDYRQEGGFVPIGGQEKADDVPARLSKNEFVFTADAVRNAGGGDIDKGAEIMENLMDNLEAGGKVSEESQGLEGARGMFANTQRLQNRII
jgi:hypothetical protein